LERLDLTSLALDDECIEALITIPSLTRLSELRVQHFDCDADRAVLELRSRFPKVILE
jgi:hypothetical protein